MMEKTQKHPLCRRHALKDSCCRSYASDSTNANYGPRRKVPDGVAVLSGFVRLNESGMSLREAIASPTYTWTRNETTGMVSDRSNSNLDYISICLATTTGDSMRLGKRVLGTTIHNPPATIVNVNAAPSDTISVRVSHGKGISWTIYQTGRVIMPGIA